MNDIEVMNEERFKKETTAKIKNIESSLARITELLKYGFCIKCGAQMDYAEGHGIVACTDNCGHWKDFTKDE